MVTKRIKVDDKAMGEILVADTDLKSGAESSNLEDELEEEEEEEQQEQAQNSKL